MAGDAEADDVWHCPECEYEWSGYNRAPPHAHCPECNYHMMREGPANEIDGGDLPTDDVDALLEGVKDRQRAFDMFLEGYKLGVEDENEPTVYRDKESFRQHIRRAFSERWDDAE